MLRELQAGMGRSLLDDFKAPPPDGLVAGDPARAARRFMIHRGNVADSLANALGHTYPAIKAICGEDNFRLLAIGYVRAHPPERPALLAYGGGFAAHVAAHAAAMRDFPFLPDLARLEWALNEAYYAADAPALTPEALGAVAPARLGALRLRLHPAARLIVSDRHPVHALWSAASARAAGRDPLALGGTLSAGREAVLVARPAGPVAVFRLDAGDAAFLAAVAAGATLEDALSRATEAAPGFDAPAALAAALVRGAFGAELTDRPHPGDEA